MRWLRIYIWQSFHICRAYDIFHCEKSTSCIAMPDFWSNQLEHWFFIKIGCSILCHYQKPLTIESPSTKLSIKIGHLPWWPKSSSLWSDKPHVNIGWNSCKHGKTDPGVNPCKSIWSHYSCSNCCHCCLWSFNWDGQCWWHHIHGHKGRSVSLSLRQASVPWILSLLWV